MPEAISKLGSARGNLWSKLKFYLKLKSVVLFVVFDFTLDQSVSM